MASFNGVNQSFNDSANACAFSSTLGFLFSIPSMYHLCPLASGKLATEAFPVQPELDTFP